VDVEIRIDGLPGLDVDNDPLPQIVSYALLWTSDAEEIVSQVEVGIDPHVGLA
jgi:hypothetical protein